MEKLFLENKMIIGLTGPAQSGKDSFFELAKEYFNSFDIRIKRVALADNLKKDLSSFMQDKFNIDIFNISPEDKELIRDLMVVYGKIKRQQTEGTYWTKLITNKLHEDLKENHIIFITDIRYAYYPQDELSWLRSYNKNLLLHISRLDKNGLIIPPRNLEEGYNDPILKRASDLQLCWHTTEDLSFRKKESEEVLNKIYENYRTR